MEIQLVAPNLALPSTSVIAQQADGPGGHQPAELLHPVQIPQKQPQRQKQAHAPA